MSEAAVGRPALSRQSSAWLTIAALAGLYTGQSILGGIAFLALPSVLRERGLPLDAIGLIYLISLPWALKIAWSAAVERYRLPPTGPTRSRQIVFACGLFTLAGLIAVAIAGPERWHLVLAIFIAVAFAASTADIACDGHAVETLAKIHHGWGNAAQVGGAYLGSALGSGLFLVLVARIDWTGATLAAAGLFAVLMLPFLLSKPAPAPDLRTHQPSLKAAFARPRLRNGLWLAALYVAAQKWGVGMLAPMLVDAGLDLETLGAINGLGGLAVGLGCALLGGGAVRLWGARPIMIVALLLQAVTLAALAVAIGHGRSSPLLLAGLALASSSGIMALGFVALYARFMAIADPRQAGVDFTLLQGTDSIVSMVGGLGAGWVAQHFGYTPYLAGAALLALLAAPLALWLTAPGRGEE